MIMSTITPRPIPAPTQAGFEYLVMGDLRLALEEAPSPDTEKWMLSLLDVLLAHRPTSPLPSPVSSRVGKLTDPAEYLLQERAGLYSKFQRLRDRIAHRTPYSLIANELRCDLQDLMDT